MHMKLVTGVIKKTISAGITMLALNTGANAQQWYGYVVAPTVYYYTTPAYYVPAYYTAPVYYYTTSTYYTVQPQPTVTILVQQPLTNDSQTEKPKRQFIHTANFKDDTSQSRTNNLEDHKQLHSRLDNLEDRTRLLETLKLEERVRTLESQIFKLKPRSDSRQFLLLPE